MALIRFLLAKRYNLLCVLFPEAARLKMKCISNWHLFFFFFFVIFVIGNQYAAHVFINHFHLMLRVLLP